MSTTTVESRIESIALAPRPFYTRVAALGFGLIALVGVIVAVFGLITGNTDEILFVVPIMIIALLIAGAVLRFGVWAQILAGLLSFALLALVLPFSTFTLQHPEDAGNFIPLVVLVVGAVFGFIGSIVSLIQRRRRTLRAAATPAESIAVQAILSALALVAVASLLLTVTARTTVSAEGKAGALSVEQKSFKFSPDQIQVKAGQTVRVVVKNSDPTLHTFTIDKAEVNVSIPPGAERLIEFQAPASGAYQLYCIPHSDPGPNGRTGMVGSLIVQ